MTLCRDQGLANRPALVEILWVIMNVKLDKTVVLPSHAIFSDLGSISSPQQHQTVGEKVVFLTKLNILFHRFQTFTVYDCETLGYVLKMLS